MLNECNQILRPCHSSMQAESLSGYLQSHHSEKARLSGCVCEPDIQSLLTCSSYSVHLSQPHIFAHIAPANALPSSLMLHPNLGVSLVPLLACYDLHLSRRVPRARTAHFPPQCFAGHGAPRLLVVPSPLGLPHSVSLVHDCVNTFYFPSLPG